MNKKPIDTKIKAAISAAIQAYLSQSSTGKNTRTNNKTNAWKLFTSTNYNILRATKRNPWKNHLGFYD